MDFEAGGSAVLGDGERRGITGFVNGALLPGQVAMRVDAGYDNSGGYYKDAVSGQRLSARETWFARAGLLAQMSDRVKAVLQLSYEDSHEIGRESCRERVCQYV